jgi:hypothetical protein
MSKQLCQISINGEYICSLFINNNDDCIYTTINEEINEAEIFINKHANICESIRENYPEFNSMSINEIRVFRPTIGDTGGTDTRSYLIENERINNLFNSTWSNLMRLFPQCAFQFNITGITSNPIS